MPKYLALYSASSEPMPEMTPEEGQAMMQAWFDWRDGSGDAIVDFGAPTVPASEGASSVGGYSIVCRPTASMPWKRFSNPTRIGARAELWNSTKFWTSARFSRRLRRTEDRDEEV